MLITKKQLRGMVQLSHAHIDRKNDPKSSFFDPAFPKRVRIGFRVFWVRDEVVAYVQRLIEQRDRSS